MNTSTAQQSVEQDHPYFAVRESRIHGRGVFATRDIPAGALVIEYTGTRLSSKQAVQRYKPSPDNPTHTFYFSLENGKVIDGGNDARWINHACEPNCEAREEGSRIFIYALRAICCGEELNYDYGLVVEERYTASVKRAYACLCGARSCRHTMLAPKRRSRKQAS